MLTVVIECALTSLIEPPYAVSNATVAPADSAMPRRADFLISRAFASIDK
ncbi:hypothetical protein [Nocardia seriolae]|nr:hypothetical protein [Nocardia seriolae]MTL13609.1 hypothetical protein [Nocardia seriolae]